ncbi:MAG: tetratricopeptide repeat protein [Myxococcota bacterium]|nr:tetratricopeptide repeat protein [Myxococcota bacterium]
MADPLELIRSKVVAGERLDDAQFALLEKAAAQQRTPSLRLAVAHALMNAEEDRRALELLRPLCAERPQDPNVRLGLARALLGLERYPDAEEALKEALALRPGDPEALKALAALTMRHGGLDRARQLVAQALLRDPFDGEARLLKEELESAAAAPAQISTHPPVPPAEFSLALRAQLRTLKVSHQLRGTDLLLPLPAGGVARVGVRSLYAAYARGGDTLQAGVREAVSQLQALRGGLPPTREDLLARVLPVLRPARFLEAAPGAAHREGPVGLLIFYVLEDPELLRYVPSAQLDTIGVTLEALDASAWTHLARTLAVPIGLTLEPGGHLAPSDAPSGLCALASGDGHDAARLLLPEQQRRLEARLGPGPWKVSLGRRELAVVGLTNQALEGLPTAPDGIEGLFELTVQGQLRGG